MTLEGSLDVAVSDGAATLTFTVRNAGEEAVDLQFSDGCKADFVVEADGQERWRFSEGRMFTQVLSTDTVPPGGEVTYEATCESLESGRYDVRAELRSTNRTCSARTTVSI